MRVKQRLLLNAMIPVITACLVILMLFLALYHINRAMKAQDIAVELIYGTLERITLRNDYVRSNTDRARIQWFAKHEQIERLLREASDVFTDKEDKREIDAMLKDQEAVGKIFSRLVENRQEDRLRTISPELSREIENRLLSQLNVVIYDKVLHGRKLQERSRAVLVSTFTFAGAGIVGVFGIVITAAIVGAVAMGRAINDPIELLREGASAIGEGNLDHQIDVRGEDELAELSLSFNAMTVKLRNLYKDFEKEIEERSRAEEALRKSEEHLKRAQEIAHLGSWELDLAHNRLSWSDEVYRIFGLQPQEFAATYEAFLAVVHPDDRAAVDEAYSGSLRDGRDAYEIEHRIVRKPSGEIRVVHEKCEHIRDNNGEVIISAGMVHDVTARKLVEEELQKSYARLNLLAETVSELLKSESPQQLVDSLCCKVMRFLDCDIFFNFLVDDRKGCLHLNAFGGIPAEEAKKIEWLDYGVAVCGCAARDACRIVAENIPATPDPRTELVRSYGVKAYACHPLIVQGRVLGTLSFGTRTRTTFAAEELSLMQAVAGHVAIAIQRMKSQQELQKAHDRLELRVRQRTEDLAKTVDTLREEIAQRESAENSLQRLNRLYLILSEIDKVIVRANDRDSLFRDFCRIAVEHGGFLLCWVGLIEESTGCVNIMASQGATEYLKDIRITVNEEESGYGPTGIAVTHGLYYICNDFLNDPCTGPWQDRARAHGIRSSASIALRLEGRVTGALTLYSAQQDFFDEQHVDLLKQMGMDISFALDNMKLQADRRRAERALQVETEERLRAMEELREKEQLLMQQSRQAAMGEMIGNIAHQWRQPLNMLGLIIQELPLMYKRGKFNEEYLRKNVEKGKEIIFHMSDTIDDFRNFFRPDKEKVVFPVQQVVNRTVAMIQGSFRDQRIALEVDAVGAPQVHGYPNEFSQVIFNILGNARDAFMERKTHEPRITIRVFTDGGKTVVTIADNAGGIPGDILYKIFDPYFTTKGPDKGTGIGLYMSKTIIEKNMGGRLTARNIGDGAEFRVEV